MHKMNRMDETKITIEQMSMRSMKRAGIIFLCLMITLTAVGFFMEKAEVKQESETAISVLPEVVLVPGGQSIGVRMDVKGVLIVGLEEIETVTGEYVNPGLLAGLQIGDTIMEINGTKVYRAAEVQQIINQIGGDVHLKVQRKDEIVDLFITPVVAKSDRLYKLGVWVKDKTAGIGTLTFYNPSDNSFGALGHAIVDPETGSLLSVAEGELLQAEVQSIKEGKAGTPGEIRGIFYEADAPLGDLTKNTIFGIFGTMYDQLKNPIYSEPLVVAYQDQVVKGPAYILTTLDEKTVEKFEIEIEKVTRQTLPDSKSMVIRVTDPRLLGKSGGIVQGMSGSPIIQNGRIIGAVTHVFVNNPQKGYGIFIEWMLDASKS